MKQRFESRSSQIKYFARAFAVKSSKSLKLGLQEASVGTEPFAFGHQVPVGTREYLLLNLVERLRWLSLVGIEGGGCHSAVLELAHHQLIVTNVYRAGCITIVGCLWAFASQLSNDIVDEDWSL